ncbi:hypothetical protein C8F04DRAFT_1234760 [Mycena alexandri]|uniref:Uncharacterized protein n=1 Tax=Mycena alexandri TaxID=1745969 RepID=A0AAD6ST58_9AGAR|nr:hypothetical protein C8F04DRAFT_1234760 [Mycena alexandri]
MHFAASRRAASNLNILLQTLACSMRFLGLTEREWREITDAAPRALRRAAPRRFETQCFSSKRSASGSPVCSRSENGNEALTRRCCALRRVARRDLEKKNIFTYSVGEQHQAGNGGAVLPRLIPPAPRRVRHAASYRCYRRIPPRDAAVSPRPKVRTRRSYHALRRVPPRTAASPPHHRRVQVFFFGIKLEVLEFLQPSLEADTCLKSVCVTTRMFAHASAEGWRRTDRGHLMPFILWETTDFKNQLSKVCTRCMLEMRVEHQRALESLWDHLPSLCDLPGWDELEKRKHAAGIHSLPCRYSKWEKHNIRRPPLDWEKQDAQPAFPAHIHNGSDILIADLLATP